MFPTEQSMMWWMMSSTSLRSITSSTQSWAARRGGASGEALLVAAYSKAMSLAVLLYDLRLFKRKLPSGCLIEVDCAVLWVLYGHLLFLRAGNMERGAVSGLALPANASVVLPQRPKHTVCRFEAVLAPIGFCVMSSVS